MFNGCTTTRIFCRPNCPPGRRTKPEHRVRFATAQQAAAAGYRPCLVCEPLTGAAGPWRPKRRQARSPVVAASSIALMPDAHVGIGSTVGSVMPTDGATARCTTC